LSICELVPRQSLEGVNNESMDTTSIRHSDPVDTSSDTSLKRRAAQEPRQFAQVSNELFCMDGEWFFQTPENNHGPFTKREAAEQALERFVDDQQ